MNLKPTWSKFKLEIEKNPIVKIPEPILQTNQPGKNNVREQVINIIKQSENEEGIDVEKIINELKTLTPDQINHEIISLLEDGAIYEPRPGRVRYLG